jgi:iron complex transport system permease protein
MGNATDKMGDPAAAALGGVLTGRRYAVTLAVLGAVLAGVMVASPLVGPTWRTDWPTVQARVPQVVLAALAGAGLALAGASFQAMLRNPLATPYTLGVASGGALGANLAIQFGAAGGLLGQLAGLQAASFLGAAAVCGAVYGIARRRGGVSMAGLLLAGVTVGLICASLILLLRYFAEPTQAKMIDRWMMGSTEAASFREFSSMLPLLAPGVVLLLAQGPAYNQLALGEDLAAARGVNVGAVRAATFFGGSLVTASVVAVAGPIGFVGLIVPHALRRLTGSDHRLLLPASLLGGAILLLACDTLGRGLYPLIHAALPVGVITSLIGGPVFIAILMRRHGRI